MSHYITVPVNENGIVFDATMNSVVQEAITIDPFGFQDVFLYSHGWSTDAYQALDMYNQFSVELAKQILLLESGGPSVFAKPPGDSLGVGIHWPSEITEDPTSPLNALQLFTFYTMEHRADAVGRNAVYSMVRLMLAARASTTAPLRFFLLGHSFGCKVICAALQDLQTDIDNGTIPVGGGTSFSVVLIEPATDNDNLEPGDIYGSVYKIKNLRMLITKSSLDRALNEWFPAAGRLANLFRTPQPALGASGPTQPTIDAFGGADQVSVGPGFALSAASALKRPLVVADLSAIHQARVNDKLYPPNNAPPNIGGSHSDINFTELYQLICGFFFG
jgi:hypothetical protein